MSYTELESGYQGLKQDINSSCGLGSGSEGNGNASQTPSGRPGFYVGDDGAIITIGRVCNCLFYWYEYSIGTCDALRALSISKLEGQLYNKGKGFISAEEAPTIDLC